MKRIEILTTLLITAIAPIIWGSTYIVTTELLPANSPLLASTFRALPAGIILILLTRTLPSGHWWVRLPILGFLNIGFFFYCLFYAATYLPGGMAALIMSIQPILVMGLSYVLLNNKLSSKQILASFVGMMGIALLVLNNHAALNLNGIIVGLFGTVSMSLGVVMTKRWGRPKGMTMLGFTGWQLFFGGLLLLPIALTVEHLPATLTLKNYLGYSYLCLFGAIISYSLWFRGIEKLPTTSLSFLGFLSSVSAVILGYVILNQSLTWLQLCGAVAIFVSILLAAPKTARHQALPILNVQNK